MVSSRFLSIFVNCVAASNKLRNFGSFSFSPVRFSHTYHTLIASHHHTLI